jgi:hypothetical protein
MHLEKSGWYFTNNFLVFYLLFVSVLIRKLNG